MIVMAKYSLSVMKYVQPETELRINENSNVGRKWPNSKLKHRTAHNSILSGRFGDPYRRPGDWQRIRESWHVCYSDGENELKNSSNSILMIII